MEAIGPQGVYSFDHVAINDKVTACDIKKVPLVWWGLGCCSIFIIFDGEELATLHQRSQEMSCDKWHIDNCWNNKISERKIIKASRRNKSRGFWNIFRRRKRRLYISRSKRTIGLSNRDIPPNSSFCWKSLTLFL